MHRLQPRADAAVDAADAVALRIRMLLLRQRPQLPLRRNAVDSNNGILMMRRPRVVELQEWAA